MTGAESVDLVRAGLADDPAVHGTVKLSARAGMEQTLSRQVVVNNPQGLHARPADLFVKLAKQYQAQISVVCRRERVDGKSILDMMTLAATAGTELTIEATGADAVEALDALCNQIESDKGENPHGSK